MKIDIGQGYVITSDAHQFVLNERKVTQVGKNAGTERITPVGYYSHLSTLFTALYRRKLCQGHATTLAELAEHVNRTEQDIKSHVAALEEHIQREGKVA